MALLKRDEKCGIIILRRRRELRNMREKLPKRLEEMISGKKFVQENIGMSSGRVYISDDSVLKIETDIRSAAATVEMMRWLEGRVPAPVVRFHEIYEGESFLLMSRLGGKMACDSYYLERPKLLIPLLARALKSLWEVDISDCPRCRDLETELLEARYRVEHGLVDMDNVEPETFGEWGFKDPMELLEWLERNKPEAEPVLSHGDFCLPNVLFDGENIVGYIDLGDTGVGDKWRDISLCYRSLKHNVDGTYGNVYDIDPDALFDELGLDINDEKLRYYILLDELF